MADKIAAEFIPWKKIENTQIQNAIGMADIVAQNLGLFEKNLLLLAKQFCNE
ncbi:hypothetical protein [Dyadobacter sp. 3J3]|uniref:hypothetical protein n=1 Tax=Dyadobacter sp. 3J3 TaxID=2606600 RepID=UPI00135B3826|nr:hypothetical protein [Dyadobacter sp. 3J3]